MLRYYYVGMISVLYTATSFTGTKFSLCPAYDYTRWYLGGMVGHSFYPSDTMLAQLFARATCLSVCLSHAGIVSKRRKLMISTSFGSPTIGRAFTHYVRNSSSRSSKVIDLGANRKHIYTFLLPLILTLDVFLTVYVILTHLARK